MQIIFTSKKIQKTCSDKKVMIRELGPQRTAKLMQRMMELDAAPNMSQIPTHAGCHPLTGKRAGCYAVHLSQPYRLVFRPVFDEAPLNEDGGLDLSRVDKIKIIEIVDYH